MSEAEDRPAGSDGEWRIGRDWAATWRVLTDPVLDPLFWRAERLGQASAWWEHVPFARWLVCATMPRVFVELGTQSGVSYAAFCQAVLCAGLATRCHAVDTWQGDAQAGFYGEAVFDEFRRFHDETFGAFSTLLRCSFDDALDRIEDGEVDLLHIDGLHSYEAVSRDFEHWRRKMSDRGVVLFHDINERNESFGVWRLWSELRRRHPAFEFLHGHGLGVLAVGAEPPAPVRALCELTHPAAVATVRTRFARLGEHWLTDTRARMLAQEAERLRARVEEAEAAAAAAGRSAGQAAAEAVQARERAAAAEAEAARATEKARQADTLAARVAQAEATARRRSAEATAVIAKLTGRIERTEAALAEARAEHDRVLSSTTWQMTRPVRAIAAYLPARLRRTIRATARFGWRLFARPAPPAASAAAPSSPPALSYAVSDVRSRALRFVYISGEPDTPGHRYRVARPAATAAALGAETSVISVADIPASLGEIAVADALVIWRAPWDQRIADAIGEARQGGAKILFDVDDLMIGPDAAKADIIDAIRSQNLSEEEVAAHYALVRQTMMSADLCIAPTEELAQEARRAFMPAIVLPNGLDRETIAASRLAARRRREIGALREPVLRIGYAVGTRTHQRDFAACADAVAAVLRARPDSRLVLFRLPQLATLDLDEFPGFNGLERQIEWRDLVPLERLPEEIARFDVNLAPLEAENRFCEAKSELKLFEAALVDVPTIASPTGPFRRAIRHGETGFLAITARDWEEALTRLADDAELRRRISRAARREALWRFGPERRAEIVASVFDFVRGRREAARSFALDICRDGERLAEPPLAEHDVVFEADRGGLAEVTVVVPLHNYAHHVEEALDSVAGQSLAELDLVVVEDRSTDNSLAVATRWMKAHASRFNRIVLLRNRTNSGLARTRNTGFDAADTPFVLPLDADNRLLPQCAARCLKTLKESGAAFAYPAIRKFGTGGGVMGDPEYRPHRLIGGNYIDAMALVAKAAWIAVGGYNHGRGGWEDFAFWCRLAERGFWGERVPGEPLAEYRVHDGSMIQQVSQEPKKLRRMMDEVGAVHPWLRLVWPLPSPEPAPDRAISSAKSVNGNRVDRLLPLLRCPETAQPLKLALGGDALESENGSRRWPIVFGRPVLFPGMGVPEVNPDSHLSNPLPDTALALINGTTGPVLHLSAGGTARRFDHVVEVEAAVFRHTDLIADVHRLPFADGVFDAAIALNAFEHYRDPRAAAREIRRVLRPGGRVLIRTAFMQPLHEAPWHFYNCTRYGLEAWLEGFDTEKLHVSPNFHPGYSLSWLVSELDAALRKHASPAEADAFLGMPVGRTLSLWREPNGAGETEPLWSSLAALPQEVQETTAAGFEFLGRKPLSRC